MTGAAEQINDLYRRIQQLEVAMMHLERTTVFQSGLCLLDTLQSKRQQLVDLKNRWHLCQQELQVLRAS